MRTSVTLMLLLNSYISFNENIKVVYSLSLLWFNAHTYAVIMWNKTKFCEWLAILREMFVNLSLSLFPPSLYFLFIFNRAILLTNNAMFGNIISSSSVPLLIFGTYSNGWSSRAVTVLLSLNRTFACSNDSLKIYQNLSFFYSVLLKIQFSFQDQIQIWQHYYILRSQFLLDF